MRWNVGIQTLMCLEEYLSFHRQATYIMLPDTYPMRYLLGRQMLIDSMLIHCLTGRRELYTKISPQLTECQVARLG